MTSHIPEEGSKQEEDQQLVWCFTPNPDLPNVLLIGDSISIGYHFAVRDAMKGIANVYRPIDAPADKPENVCDTALGVQRVAAYIGLAEKWDVIHFNYGLHDLKHMGEDGKNTNDTSCPNQVPVEQYETNIREIATKLKATGAKVIFGTTTPVVEGTTNPGRRPENVVNYNDAAKKVMAELDIEIDDLYAFALPQILEIQLHLNVHFTDEGSAVLGAEVACHIKKALAE